MWDVSSHDMHPDFYIYFPGLVYAVTRDEMMSINVTQQFEAISVRREHFGLFRF